MKTVFIAEKPSVAQEFARALDFRGTRRDGYLASEDSYVTWCVGHLVTMSYPEKYDEALRRWRYETLPFLPDTFLYELIPAVEKQFEIVKSLLTDPEVGRIYVCTDAGREGEYIYRLVEQMCGETVKEKERLRVWIDSFTDEEIMRGIREAKPLSDYDHLSDAAYLRAKEDYLMGINFSRVLTLKYGDGIASFLKEKRGAISVGRVMTCVLGMVVRREREIRAFQKTAFFRVLGDFDGVEAEWRADELTPALYKENGFLKRADAQALIDRLRALPEQTGQITALTKKTEKKNPPLLFNLAELQNSCSKQLKISPDETLQIAQELYEKKLTTYPRTDARVITTAVASEISRNLNGLARQEAYAQIAAEILAGEAWKTIGKSRYTNDKAVTDHYAIIPTGVSGSALQQLSPKSRAVYDMIVRRFLQIFYPPEVAQKMNLTLAMGEEKFYASFKSVTDPGFTVLDPKKAAREEGQEEEKAAPVRELKKGMVLPLSSLSIKEGETTPPKRYTSGSLILAMENAGQLIEEESLRETIKGAGIGTSATRAEILKKLCKIDYLSLQQKTQVITPTLKGEMVNDAVYASIRPLLDPALTASWEKGLRGVSEGNISTAEYMEKLTDFVRRRTEAVKDLRNLSVLMQQYRRIAVHYQGGKGHGKTNGTAKA